MEEQAENFSLWMDMEGPQFATPTALLCTCVGFILHSKLVEWDDVDDELSQRDAVIRSTVRRHWLNATIVWDFSYTDGKHTALSSVNISPQSAPHMMQEKEKWVQI